MLNTPIESWSETFRTHPPTRRDEDGSSSRRLFVVRSGVVCSRPECLALLIPITIPREKIIHYIYTLEGKKTMEKTETMATIADAGNAKCLCGSYFNFTFFYRKSERRRNLYSHQNVLDLTGATFDVTSV